MSLRQREDMILRAYIRSIHLENYQSYARERMTKELRDLGFTFSKRRVSRLMKDNNIFIKQTHKFKRTTNGDHNHNVAPKLLEGDLNSYPKKTSGNLLFPKGSFPALSLSREDKK